MSSNLHYEIARVRQDEIAARAVHAHHRQDLPASDPPRRSVRRRITVAVASVGASLVVTAAVMTGGAHANPRAVRSSEHVTARQLDREIRALEAKGYKPSACVIGGTLMRDYATGRSLIVRW